MIKHLLFFVIFLIGSFSKAQNLVPNPGFELLFECPYNGGQIYFLPYWNNPTWQGSTSPDFFHSCGSLGYQLPTTLFGDISANTDDGCSGILTYHSLEYREYIQVELNSTLINGYKYCVSFHVALADSVQYGAPNIGAYFSIAGIDQNIDSALPYIPQISNPLTNSLNSKGTWVEISGEFIAQGGEKHLIIGNFDSNIITDEFYLSGASWAPYSFYYIDDVSVELCDSTIGISQNNYFDLEIFPNPSIGLINISSYDVIKSIAVIDSQGKIIFENNFDDGSKELLLDLQNIAKGIYFLQVRFDADGITKKIVLY